MMESYKFAPDAVGPIEILKAEHRLIEKVLEATERMVDRAPIDRAYFLKAIEFLSQFADGVHHAKEEEELFPALESAGIPHEGGPIGCMLHEHDQGRSFIRGMIAALDAAASGDAGGVWLLQTAVRQYVQLLRQHIQKEDNVLFRIADSALAAEDQQHMFERFEQAEKAGPRAGATARYVALAEELCRQAARA